MTQLRTFELLDVKISAVNLDLAGKKIASWIKERYKGYVCVAPVSTVVDARRSPEYRDIVNRAEMVTPDGMPVAWLGRSKGFSEVDRTYGPDLMLKLCEMGQRPGWRHFFYGGTDEVCDKLVRSLKERFPEMIVAGTFAPPYMPKAEQLGEDLAGRINVARPDILWVGLGSPKQDYWMAINRQVLEVPVMIGIGAAFDFHAGCKPQAPYWMQRSGLEWLFRLCCEPRRLWRRYLVGNFLFVFWILTDPLKRLFQRTR